MTIKKTNPLPPTEPKDPNKPDDNLNNGQIPSPTSPFEKHEDHSQRNYEDVKNADISVSHYSIKDDYLMSCTNQLDFGLCWSFSSTRALETTLLKAQNELYKISEAGFDIARVIAGDYQIGEGGKFSEVANALWGLNNEYGVNKVNNVTGFLLENDYPLRALYHMNVDNRRSYYNNYLKSRYINNSQYLVKATEISATNIEAVKRHLKAHGWLEVYTGGWSWAVDQNATAKADEENKTQVKRKISSITKRGNGTVIGYYHSVSVIGWDDNYQVPGSTTKGAWVVMNSWNSDTWYLPYDYYKITSAKAWMTGFIYRKPKVLVSSSEQKIDVVDSGASNSANNFKFTPQQSKTTNVFAYKKGVNLKYSVNEDIADDFKMKSIKIYDKGKNVTFTEDRQIFVWTEAHRIVQTTAHSINYDTNAFPLTKDFYSYAHTDEEFTVYNIAGYQTQLRYHYGSETKAHYFKIKGESGKSSLDGEFFTKYLKELSDKEGEKLYTVEVYDKNDTLIEENKVRMFMLQKDYGNNIFPLLTITNGGNDKYKNQYINRPFNSESASKFHKYKLTTPDDANFSGYFYYDKNGNKKELPKDPQTGKYYIDYKIVQENYFQSKKQSLTKRNTH